MNRTMNSSVAAVSTGGIIMTNSSMGDMAGGSLAVSSSANQPNLTNTTSMMTTGQPHLVADPPVPQDMQNEKMAAMVIAMQHMNTRGPVLHGVHTMGSRMQPQNMLQMGSVDQGMAENSSCAYSIPNPGEPEGIQVGVVALQQPPTNIGIQQICFGHPVGPTSVGEGGIGEAPAPSSAPTGTQSAPQKQTGTGAPATATNAEKCKLIQQQLVLLIHAQTCQRRESQANGEVWQCTLPHCKTMKDVLNHMTSCQAGKSCSVSHCSSSRQLIIHCKQCVQNDCPVCLPLKQASKTTPANPPQTTQLPNPSTSDTRIASYALAIQYPTTGATPTSTGLLPNAQPRPGFCLPGAGGPTIPNLTGNIFQSVQQHLVLLVHAEKCEQHELQCTFPHCKTMKNVLNHMSFCQAGKSCSVPYCSTSHQIISHWNRCIQNNSECSLCLPVRQANKKRNNRYTPANCARAPTSRNSQPRPGFPLPGAGGLTIPNLTANMGGVRLLARGQAVPNISLPLGSGSSSTPTRSTAAQLAANMQLYGVGPRDGLMQQQQPQLSAGPTVRPGTAGLNNPVNMMHKQAVQQLIATLRSPQSPDQQQQILQILRSNPQLMAAFIKQRQLGGDARIELPSSLLQAGESITTDLRNHLVYKFVQAIFPTPTHQAIFVDAMHNLIADAQKVERDMYEMANSCSEYSHLIAEKIDKIPKELAEKSQKCKEQQLQQQLLAPANHPQTIQSPNSSPSDSIWTMKRAYDALGIQYPTTGATLARNALPRPGLLLPGAGGPTIQNLIANMSGVRVLPPPKRQLAPNVRIQFPSGLQAGQVTGTPLAENALGIQYQTTGTTPTPPGLQSNAQPRPGLQLPGAGGLTIPTNMSGVRVIAPLQGQAAPNASQPLGNDFSATPTPSTAAEIATKFLQSVSRAPQLYGFGPGDGLGHSVLGSDGQIQLPSGLPVSQITATPVKGTKEWHQSVTPIVRNHYVHKLVQVMLHKPMHDYLAYALKVERGICAIANSRSEYYHLLAEKIYKIQKKYEETRQKRKERQLQEKQQQQPELRPGLPCIVPIPGVPAKKQPIVRSNL